MSENFTLNLVTTHNETTVSKKKSHGKFYGRNSYRARKRAWNKNKVLEVFSADQTPLKKNLEKNVPVKIYKSDHKKFKMKNLNLKEEIPMSSDSVGGGDVKFGNKIQPFFNKPNEKTAVKRSSLFNNNPDIPDVKQPKIAKVSEDVFSHTKFEDLNLHKNLIQYITNKLDHSEMTNIQQKTIPSLLKGSDALVKSQTGSGKTLAYAVPVIQTLQDIKPEVSRTDGPLALVLVPTRELASQTYEIFQRLTQPFRRLVATWIMGGEKRKSEKSRIRKGVNIVVGTPGRILDHITSTECFSLKNIRWLICDEADRLLDMGFEEQIKNILQSLTEQKEDQHWQTILLSATLPQNVEKLAKVALTDPVRIQIQDDSAESDESFAVPTNLIQHVAIVPSKLRLIALIKFLKFRLAKHNDKIVVFLSCRDSVSFHYEVLKYLSTENLISVDINTQFLFKLHGGMLQENRQKVFKEFTSAKCGVLLCTDVAARGLHLPHINWVVQYTSPGSPINYIHRIGRTARAGKQGAALLMLSPSESQYVNLLTQYNIEISKMSLDCILSEGNENTSGNEKQMEQEAAIQLQNKIEDYVAENSDIALQARVAYGSFIRAYASYPSSLKTLFHVKHLHLGHVAKSFALNEAPSDIIQSLQKSVKHLQMNNKGKNNKKKQTAKEVIDSLQRSYEVNALQKEKELEKKSPVKKNFAKRFNLMSEFGSGI